MVNLVLLAEHNCVSSAIAGSIDAFSVANSIWQFAGQEIKAPLFNTKIATIDGKKVTANGGVVLQPELSIEEVKDADIIFVPAFIYPFDLENERIETLCRWVADRYESGTRVASTCTGTFLLAKAGLLDGKVATTNWVFSGSFRRDFPDVNLHIDRIFTEDNGIYSTGASTAFFDLCLHFISKYGSADLACKCAKYLLIDTDRSSQSPYIVYNFYKNHKDREILESQEWMENNFQENISIDLVADKAGISSRHFKRRFKNATGETPIAYLQLLRIENAKILLETTGETINEITWQVGYEDINSFRKLFKKHTGMSPKDYRAKFTVSGHK